MKRIRSLTILITLVAALAFTGVTALPDTGFAATGLPQAQSSQDIPAVKPSAALPAAAPAMAPGRTAVAQSPTSIVDGVGIYIDSHESESIQVYPKGSSVRVEFTCTDYNYTGKYDGFIGLFDTVTQTYLESYETGTFYGSSSYYVNFNTNPMLLNTAAAPDRYVVYAVIFDMTTTPVTPVAEDYFFLQVKGFSAPVYVSVKPAGVHSVQVTWKSDCGHLSYQVYMSTSALGPFSYIGTTRDITSYTKTGLITGKTYYFKVRAYSTGVSSNTYSGYSTFASGAPRPLPPSKVTVTSKAYDTLNVSWTSVSGANGYVVYLLDVKTGTFVQLGTTTSTSVNYTGLSTGVDYTYAVRAWHTESNGTKYYSSLSTEARGNTIPATVTFTASLATYNSARITWTPVAGATGYAVYRNAGEPMSGPDPDGECVALLGSGARSWIDVCPVPGIYYYEVVAYRIASSGVYYFSLPVYYQTGSHTSVAFLGQTNISFNYYGGRNVRVIGSVMPEGTGYEIWRADSANPDLGFASISPTLMYTTVGIQFDDYDLLPGVSYTYKIRPYLMVSGRKVTGPVSLNTIEISLPTPNMSSSVNADKTVRIYFGSVQGSTGFEVERSLDGVTFEPLYTGTNSALIETELTPGKTYYYRSRGLYAPSGYSTPWSEIMTVTAPSR